MNGFASRSLLLQQTRGWFVVISFTGGYPLKCSNYVSNSHKMCPPALKSQAAYLMWIQVAAFAIWMDGTQTDLASTIIFIIGKWMLLWI